MLSERAEVSQPFTVCTLDSHSPANRGSIRGWRGQNSKL